MARWYWASIHSYVYMLTARADTCYQDRHMTTGMDLKLERTQQRVKARAVANVMGVSPSRIATIEALAEVQPDTAGRYREALGTCVRERTSESVEAVA
jgi:hypothetical protein